MYGLILAILVALIVSYVGYIASLWVFNNDPVARVIALLVFILILINSRI